MESLSSLLDQYKSSQRVISREQENISGIKMKLLKKMISDGINSVTCCGWVLHLKKPAGAHEFLPSDLKIFNASQSKEGDHMTTQIHRSFNHPRPIHQQQQQQQQQPQPQPQSQQKQSFPVKLQSNQSQTSNLKDSDLRMNIHETATSASKSVQPAAKFGDRREAKTLTSFPESPFLLPGSSQHCSRHPDKVHHLPSRRSSVVGSHSNSDNNQPIPTVRFSNRQ